MKFIAAAALLGIATSGAGRAQTLDAKRLIQVKDNGKWGVLDQHGAVVVPLEFDYVDIRSDGKISGLKDDREVYFDTAGRQIWNNLNKVGEPDINGYLTFRGENKLQGLIDTNGQNIVPALFGYINPFDSDKHYVAHYKGQAIVIDLQGKLLFNRRFFYISRQAKNGLAVAKPDLGSYGVIDGTGAWVIEPGRFQEIHDFGLDGLASAKFGGKWGLIDSTGRWVINPISEDFLWNDPFNDVGTKAVKVAGKWGFINRKGEFVVKPQFDRVRSPKMGVYAVEIEGREALINGRGQYLLRPKFTAMTDFDTEGLAAAWQGERSFIVNRKGQPVFGSRFERVGGFFGGGWAAAQLGGKWGAIDTRGNWILKPTYQCVSICFDQPPPPLETTEMPPDG